MSLCLRGALKINKRILRVFIGEETDKVTLSATGNTTTFVKLALPELRLLYFPYPGRRPLFLLVLSISNIPFTLCAAFELHRVKVFGRDSPEQSHYRSSYPRRTVVNT